jgi:hypothetical protein
MSVLTSAPELLRWLDYRLIRMLMRRYKWEDRAREIPTEEENIFLIWSGKTSRLRGHLSE